MNTLTRLTHNQLTELHRKMEKLADEPKAARQFCEDHQTDAFLEFPLGELTNPSIEGFVIGWHLTGKIQTLPIEKTDRFNAQGLEGKVRIETTLMTALLATRDLPQFRYQVFLA